MNFVVSILRGYESMAYWSDTTIQTAICDVIEMARIIVISRIKAIRTT